MKSTAKKMLRDKYLLLLLLPCLLYYLIFKYAPMFGIVVAFKDYNMFRGFWASEWVGTKYFRLFLSNPDSVAIIRNTFLLGLYKLVFGFPVPIIFALLLNEVRSMIMRRFVQTVSYLPHFVSNVIVASTIIMFLNPMTGPINQLIVWLGFKPINFMAEPGMFRSIYVLSEIWQHMGWSAIIYLAALSAVNPHLYEAARIDGANRWKQTIHVTLPSITPVMILLLILNIGQVMDIGFEKVFLLSNPVIYETADILSTYVYRAGFSQGNYSYAATIDLFTSVVSFVFVYAANTISRRWGESLW